MARTAQERRTQGVEINEQPPRELDFERGDERSGRVGDLRDPGERREEFPKVRERLAGRSGGENPSGEVTADDLAPETLLDEDLSRTPEAGARREPLDEALREVDEDRIGEGHGKDEAELAREDPLDGRRARRGK